MPRHDPDSVSFDVSTYFSKEEWKLLHKWQKELYRNVMKEIHQALISLGPLITHTVFSLKAKEKEELSFSNNQESSQSDAAVSPKESNNTVRDENIPRSLGGRRRNGHLMTEDEPLSGLLDHLSEEVGESSTDPNSGHEIISFAIKDEEEIEFIDRPDCRQTESVETPTAYPVITSVFSQTIKPEEDMCIPEQRGPLRKTSGERSRKSKRKYKLKSANEETPDNASGESSTNMLQSSKKGTRVQNPLLSETLRDLQNEEPSAIKSVSANEIHSNVEGSGSHDESESSPKNAKLSESQKNTVLNSRTYENMEDVHTFIIQGDSDSHQEMYLGEIPSASTDSEKAFNIDVYFKGQNKCEEVGHTVVGAYACNVCGKTFSQKGSLTRHQTIHTGIRYACNECEKSFTRKEMLTVHKRKHTGEKPYQCTDCGKRFSHTGYLFSHKKKHTGVKPYKCTECGKCFSFKGNFVIHERSHASERPGP